MQQPSFNTFNQIRKGLRALLYQTAVHSQHTDFTNADEAKDIHFSRITGSPNLWQPASNP